MPRESPLTAIHAVRNIERLPDGSPIPSSLSHALLVLATYYPNIWPSQARLARDMNITPRNVQKRLKALEDAGLIERLHRGRHRSTLYRLDLAAIRRGVGSDVSEGVGSDAQWVSVATLEDQRRENEGAKVADSWKDPDEDYLPF
jgi:DNA-binding transcriptional ArsR family regulator